MHRIDNTTALSAIPTPVSPGAPGYFTNGNPTQGLPATIVEADWMNAVQEEISYVIESSGLTLSKTDRTQLYQALLRLGRFRLYQPTTIYISTTGNDATADGLTPETAFATLTAAWDFVRDRINPNGYQVTFDFADGIYPQAKLLGPIIPTPMIFGNRTVPLNVTLSGTTAPALLCGQSAEVLLDSFYVTASGMPADYVDAGDGLQAKEGGKITFQNMVFGPCNGAHLAARQGATITLGQQNVSYNIRGGAQFHAYCNATGNVAFADAHITVTGNPNFSVAFAGAYNGSIMQCGGNTFSGTATGSRYMAAFVSCINTGGAGLNYFPGNAAGAALYGGVYA